MPTGFNAEKTAALELLGYTPYDFIRRPILSHMPLWTPALRKTLVGQGKA